MFRSGDNKAKEELTITDFQEAGFIPDPEDPENQDDPKKVNELENLKAEIKRHEQTRQKLSDNAERLKSLRAKNLSKGEEVQQAQAKFAIAQEAIEALLAQKREIENSLPSVRCMQRRQKFQETVALEVLKALNAEMGSGSETSTINAEFVFQPAVALCLHELDKTMPEAMRPAQQEADKQDCIRERWETDRHGNLIPPSTKNKEFEKFTLVKIREKTLSVFKQHLLEAKLGHKAVTNAQGSLSNLSISQSHRRGIAEEEGMIGRSPPRSPDSRKREEQLKLQYGLERTLAEAVDSLSSSRGAGRKPRPEIAYPAAGPAPVSEGGSVPASAVPGADAAVPEGPSDSVPTPAPVVPTTATDPSATSKVFPDPRRGPPRAK